MSDDMLGRAVGDEVLGPLKDLLTKLGSEEVGAEWQRALGVFLRKRNPWPMLVAPDDLAEILGQQVDRLVGIKAHEQLGLDEATYREQLHGVTKAFSWRPEWAEHDLKEPVLVEPRFEINPDLSLQFLADAAGIDCYIDSDACSNFGEFITPTMPYVTQVNPGPKYRNKKPFDVRDSFPAIERGIVLPETLCWALYQEDLVARLKECYMDIVGSVAPGGRFPYLYLRDGRPALRADYDGHALPRYGAGSAGSELGS